MRQRRYHWQAGEQLTEIDDSQQGNTTFSYDAVGNLSGARYADGEQQLRQPDAVGNLFRTAARTDRTYGRGGQLREAGGTRYAYDGEGNLVRKTLPDGRQWRYAWDGAGQLVEVTRPDGYAVRFSYDAFGRRVSKRFRGRVTHWVWDGDKPLHKWHELAVGPGAGSASEVLTWLFEEERFAPVAKLTALGAQSVVCDHLGTPLSLHDGQGAVTWELNLDSYGGVRQGRGRAQDCPFRYQGQYEDAETGLYYNRFRYYDPEAGRYISQDPIRLRGGITVYTYACNPNTSFDILGLSVICHGQTPVGNLQHYSGTEPPLIEGATPNSLYSHIHPKTGKVVQNAIYDSNGDVIGHVDFKNHGIESGHWHQFPPAKPGLGHGKGAIHNPHTTVPDGWNTLPPGVAPNLPIGSL